MKNKRIVCESKEIICSDISYGDVVIDYIVNCSIDFYSCKDEDEIDIYDNKKRRKIGSVNGYLILCRVMDQLDEDVYTVCDDHSAELEMVMSILTNHNKDYAEEDVFYITDTTLEEMDFIKVMNRLPNIILTHYHVYPNIICYYPAPLPYEKEKPPIYQAKEKMAQIIARDILEQNLPKLSDEENADYMDIEEIDDFDDFDTDENDEAEKVTVSVHLDEEQQNYILGRWNDYNVYPESAKNREVFEKFEQAGFKEFRGLRLLVRQF